MKYRVLGKTGVKVSALGFGAMRLPTLADKTTVDEAAAVEMLRHALDRGVNYIDTAYVYHGGRSEVIVGKALDEGYREKTQLATKLPIWNVKKLKDCGRLLDEQLDRLQTSCIDFYLLHCLQKDSWPRLRDLGVMKWAESARASGKIRHIGFSFHDDYEVFKQIVDEWNWDFCQIQYNYVCEDVQAGTKGLQYAAGKGLGVIVMEPLFGGTLVNPPEPVRQVWQSAGAEGRYAELALRWLWDKPEVGLVLSGMSNLQQTKENIATAARADVGGLSDRERELIQRIQAEYRKLAGIPCTKCGYCVPCPKGVNIPYNFELYNHATVFQGSSGVLARNLYGSLPESARAAACESCGACEERCPQKLPIPALLEKVKGQFQAG